MLCVKRIGILTFLILTLVVVTVGCASSGETEKTKHREIDYTVVEPGKLPEELSRVIEENKKKEIRMTYIDGEDMYLIRGYGEQKTGGYSIAVAECTEDDTRIYFDTRLLGPTEEEGLSKDPSYPCLIVKIEARNKEVMIQ